MKTYAQKDYPQTLGKSDYTIAEAGAFLTAIANLLGRFGHDVTPLHLQNFFTIKGIDSAKLTVGAVSVYDAKLAVNTVGMGTPQFSDSIVKMKYISKLTDTEVATYCLVESIEDKTIVDSFDGIVKSWDVYGGPVSFITFAKYDPVKVIPLKAPVAPVATAEPSPDTFHVPVYTDGYTTLHDAIDRQNISGVVNPGEYFVFDMSGTAVNVTNEIGKEGLWINRLDIRVAETAKDQDNDGIIDITEIKPPVQSDLVIVHEPTLNLHEDDEIDTTGGIFEVPEWQESYKVGLNPIDAVAIDDITITDLTGEREPKVLPKGEIKTVVGTFKIGTQTYFRTKESAEAGAWYGIPRELVRRLADVREEEDEFDNQLNDIVQEEEMGRHEKAIQHFATIEGKTRRLFKLKTKKG